MRVPRFIIPEFALKPVRQVEIPFRIAVPTLGYRSVVSGLVSYPFKVVQAKMVFSEEANNLVEHGWFTDINDGVSTTGPPPGDNIFGREGAGAYFTGKGVVKTANTNVEFPTYGLYIKFYTFNGCAYAYTANGSIVIQQI